MSLLTDADDTNGPASPEESKREGEGVREQETDIVEGKTARWGGGLTEGVRGVTEKRVKK